MVILVGGLEHGWIIFHFIYGMSSFPFDALIFFRGVETTNQIE
jgi:hypothetical protein